MTDKLGSAVNAMNSRVEAQTSPAVAPPGEGHARREYKAPRLQYLGKVADLTFSAANLSRSDGGTHSGHNTKA